MTTTTQKSIYTITASSGVSITSPSQTLHGSKVFASKWIQHGSSVTIEYDGYAICRREFWENRSSFGWDKWESCN